MSRVNKIQIAGSHYKTDYQTWDFINDLKLGYFEGNIVKYTQRHPNKAKKTDLDKAYHYTQKTLELCREGRLPQHLIHEMTRKYKNAKMVEQAVKATHSLCSRFFAANSIGEREQEVIRGVVTWRNGRDLSAIESLIGSLSYDLYGPDQAGG